MQSANLEQDQNFDAPVPVAPFLTVEEVADLLRVPPSWVYANKRFIPGYVQLGRYVRFRKGPLAQFMTSSSAERIC
jgi:predicted DNA-binding transcriptional regulator AlpA